MLLSKSKLKSFLLSPWFISLILLGVFYTTTGYHYGWDDQHLEIPLLKQLIDPELYQGDYYVESLKKNFSSYFYPILAKLITVEQIPAVYFCLFLIVRYFLFFWIYKLWLHITKSRGIAFACVLTFILITRVDEFLYRTFSHQEFALAIIFAGIYYFFKRRFLLAAIILGIATNFHALYSLFPMAFMGLYLLLYVRREGVKPLLLSCSAYLLTAMPFLIWTVKNRFTATGHIDGDWLPLYITSCPQNFFFPRFPTIPFKNLMSQWSTVYFAFNGYIYLALLFVVNLVFNKNFGRKALSFCLGAFIFVGLCFVFTYIKPHPFFLDLNLCRNTQFLLFILIGYTVILLTQKAETSPRILAVIFALIFTMQKYDTFIASMSIGLLFCLLAIEKLLNLKNKTVKFSFISLLSILSLVIIFKIIAIFLKGEYSSAIMLYLAAIITLLAINLGLDFLIKNNRFRIYIKRAYIFIPLIVFFVHFLSYSQTKHKQMQEGNGFWLLQRNWEDMQLYVKNNTPKDAMILVPYNMEMGGFRIQSERKIVCSYRDCGIIGFDYNAAVEWRERVSDILPFKVHMTESPKTTIEKAIFKYNSNYIVFMGYAAPVDNELMHRVYANQAFALYEVNNSPKVEALRKIIQEKTK